MLNFAIYLMCTVTHTLYTCHLFECHVHSELLPWFFAGMTMLWWILACYGMIRYLKGRDSS